MRKGKRSALRQSAAVSALLLAALFLLPLLVIAPFRRTLFNRQAAVDETEEKTPLPPFVSGQLDAAAPLRVLDGDEVLDMDLGEYLVGVVRAEMPASFAPEALKAQAAAARTYTLYKIQTGGNHDNADICTDHTCCQAYISQERAWANWGEAAEENEAKIRSAVSATDGQAILYDGAPVLAVFHSSSAGLTRGAGEVWMGDLPYLQPVDSPEPADLIPNYYSRVEFTPEEFRGKFLAAYPEADLSGGPSGWIRNLAADSAGSVTQVTVGGVTIRGSGLRTILGLRSACFEWALEEGKLVFYVTGYGHGVGMSQYGANAMAESGADYVEILTHYYTGVTIGPYPTGIVG